MQVEFYDKGAEKIEEAEKENRKTRITKNEKIICTPAQLHRNKMA